MSVWRRVAAMAVVGVGVVGSVAVGAGEASAQVRARSLALRADGGLAAVLHDGGLHMANGGWVCPSVHGPGRVVRAMAGGALLLGGETGAHQGLPSGCSWVPANGAVVARSTSGLHVPVEGQTVALTLMTVRSGAAVTLQLARTTDGGQTTHPTQTFAVAQVVEATLAGAGERVAIVGRRTGEAAAEAPWRLWWSDDLGATFSEVDLAVPAGDAVRAAAVQGDAAWVWVGAGLGRVDRETGEVVTERAFALAEAGWADAVAVGPDGVLWVAAGEDGLWRRDGDGAWEPVGGFEGVAGAVRAVPGRVWVGGEAARYGEPLVFESVDGGQTWGVALRLEGLEAPAGCVALLTQACKVERAALDPTLREPGAPVEPAPSAGDDGCGAARPGQGLTLALAIAALAWVARARKRDASPSAP